VGRVGRMPLSAIGRGLAASTYALSTFLYHAEFTGLPPSLSDFTHRAASVIGPGVPAPLLTGRPCEGGFGLLPPRAHTLARHGNMAARLLLRLISPSSPHPPLWTHLAAALLSHCCPALHPAQTLLAATLATPDLVAAGALGLPVPQPHRLPPGTLTHMAVALQALGPLTLPPDTDLSPADLITNPPASPELPPPQLASLGWQRPPADPAAAPSSSPPCPAATTPATTATLPPPPDPEARPSTVSLAGASVRILTRLLTAPITAHRRARHARYCRLALDLPPRATPAHQHLADFAASLRAAWRLPCDNHIKEALWRLAINCIPGSLIRPWACPCGHSIPAGGQDPRLHSFWDCPVAVAVRGQLDAALGRPVQRSSLWLLGPPPLPDLHLGVWRLACLAAIGAMEHGRALLWARFHSPAWPADADAAACSRVVTGVGNAAAARFWHHLQDFTHVHPQGLPGWDLPPSHRLLTLRGGRLSLECPGAVPGLDVHRGA
jgi:hypothetical protein